MIERVEDASELRRHLIVEGRRQYRAERPAVDAAIDKGEPVPGWCQTIGMGGRYPLDNDQQAQALQAMGGLT